MADWNCPVCERDLRAVYETSDQLRSERDEAVAALREVREYIAGAARRIIDAVLKRLDAGEGV